MEGPAKTTPAVHILATQRPGILSSPNAGFRYPSTFCSRLQPDVLVKCNEKRSTNRHHSGSCSR